MKTLALALVLAQALLLGVAERGGAADSIVANFVKNGTNAEVRFRSRLRMPVSATAAEYTVLSSTDMLKWQPVGPVLQGGTGVSDELLRQAVLADDDQAFYRISAHKKLTPEQGLGAAIYGYSTEFSRRLQALGQISLQEFTDLYHEPEGFLAQLSFAPTEADFWNAFSTNAGFSLNPEELAVFQTNAFVASQRLGTYSMAGSFYKVFTADMPVYVSCDAILHAWHRSYVNMLEELEEASLAPLLKQVLAGISSQVTGLWSQAQGTAIADGVLDADYFLAIARSLVSGTNVYGELGQTARVASTLSAITNLQPAEINLYGTNRVIDFSQFKVRGHYETSLVLSNYFRAVMWSGLADWQFTGDPKDNSVRELAGAIAMHLLLKNSGQFQNWKTLGNAIQLFVGPPDALNPAQLGDVLAAGGVTNVEDVCDRGRLELLQAQIMEGDIGAQNIQGGYFWSPLSRDQVKLPRSFAMIPRAFTVDAWTMNQCVFDRIVWDADGAPNFEDKVMRRVPSALEVAFAVFGNNHTSPLITERISNTAGHHWRDGLPYQHNLAAVRQVLDSQDPSARTNNIYQSWLECLRQLSIPTTGPEYPDAMRTRAWAMKTLNAQLASWTQLRHDTILYAKQPYTPGVLCSYPAGFVEPRVAFWEAMREMALNAKALLGTLPRTGEFVIGGENMWSPLVTNSVASICDYRAEFLANFASKMMALRDIAAKELARQQLSTSETLFIQSLIDDPTGYVSGFPAYTGWYPGLFYLTTRGKYSGAFSPSDLWDPLITDVHTDMPDDIVGDPGSILHEAVGNPALLLISVNWGPGDACVYAGPVLTHYEFELGPTTRRTDSEWKATLRSGAIPALPEWTRAYLTPGAITFPGM